MTAIAVAAVDIGTNSTNLLVTGVDGTVLARVVTVTRLGHGVDATRLIDEAAARRTLECLADYRRVWESLGASRVRIVATSATRDATNGSSFLSGVAESTGIDPEVLSGEREAELSYRGVALRSDGSRADWTTSNHVVVDIGGGSTELVIGAAGTNGPPNLVGTHSLDVGAVRLTERHLRGDPPRPEELLNAIGDVHDAFDEACLVDSRLLTPGTVVGCAGTIVTAAAVEVGLIDVDPLVVADRLDGFFLEREAVEDVFRTLATERLADRVHNPGLPRDRADVIVGGLCVLVALLRRWDAPGMLVSTRGILDGVCAEISGRT